MTDSLELVPDSCMADLADPGGAESAADDPSPPPDGYEFVVVSHALPRVRLTDGRWRFRPGGSTNALEPVVTTRRGAWVGWSGRWGDATEPAYVDHMWLYPVPLSEQDLAQHLDGYCESTLSPTYHDAVTQPRFDRGWQQAYRQVNQRYADVVAAIAAPGAIVWVHDYHLQLVPALLRQARPDLLILFFLHIPFPPVELFTRLPLRREIVTGLLGADVIGFQRPRAVENFFALARALGGLTADTGSVPVADRRVRVIACPQSIDVTAIGQRAARPSVRERAASLRTLLGSPRTVLLAVDRLHPAKGIEQRLTAYGELLDDGRLDPRQTVLVQVAAPDRYRAAGRDRLRTDVERRVAQINGAYARIGRPVVHYVHRLLDSDELVALYRAADVLLTTPLRDGTSLTAKEYVVAHDDRPGALVVSEFTATAAELPEAFVVNPYDVEAFKAGIIAAARTEPIELERRLRDMRTRVLAYDIRDWAGRLLAELGHIAAGAALVPRPGRRASTSQTLRYDIH